MDRVECERLADDAAVEAYDSFITTVRGGHYSQTRAWGQVLATAKPYQPSALLMRREGHVIGAGLLLRTQLGHFLNLPVAQMERGPVCRDPEDLPHVLQALRAYTLRHGILRLSVMPYWGEGAKSRIEEILKEQGFADGQTFGGRHARTLRLDLTALNDEKPFAAANLAKVRHEISRAERAGAVARMGRLEDFPAFRHMHEEPLRLSGKAMPPTAWYDALAEYFVDDRGAVFVCEVDGRVVSAIFVTCHAGLATYIMGTSSGEALRFSKMVQPLAKAIVWAKQNGAAEFDFGGIPMLGDTDAKRARIAEFKYSFTHHEVTLVHEHVRWF